MATKCSKSMLLIQWLLFLYMAKKCMFCNSGGGGGWDGGDGGDGGGGGGWWEPPKRANNTTDDFIRGMPHMNISLEEYIKRIEDIETGTEDYYKDVDNADAENPDLRGDLSNSSVWAHNWLPESGEEGTTLKKYKEFMKEYKKKIDEDRKKRNNTYGRPGYWAHNGTWVPEGPGGYLGKDGHWVPWTAGDGGYWGPDDKWIPGPDGGAGYWIPNGTWIPMPGDEGGYFDANGNWIVGPGGKGGGFWGPDGKWVPGPKAKDRVGYFGPDGKWYGKPTRPPGVGNDWPKQMFVEHEYKPDTPPPYAYVSESYGKPGLCFQQPKKGNCKRYHLRWGFNVYKKDCVEFVYSGCGGNSNNFLTRARCREVCLNLPKSNCEDYPPELMPHDCFPSHDDVTWLPLKLPYLKPPKKAFLRTKKR